MIDHAVDNRCREVYTLLQLLAAQGFGLNQQSNTYCTDGVCNVTDSTDVMQLVPFTLCPAGHDNKLPCIAISMYHYSRAAAAAALSTGAAVCIQVQLFVQPD